ncbi:MAG TPA: hypothetical protein VJQ83_03800 [Tepidiformaceae bacterium]|nr:hypothetical protein [Tepidiformaceae bacterium]
MSSPFTSLSRRPRRAAHVAAIALIALAIARPTPAQQPAPATVLPSYRPPVLALVQPAADGSVPQDRPVVVFRFAPGDSTDPVDARSFAITVDGKDRSAGFQAARDMVWGPLAPPDEGTALGAGAHTLVARICSIRGSCGEVSASVTIAAAAPTAADAPSPNRKHTVLDLLLVVLKKLLMP